MGSTERGEKAKRVKEEVEEKDKTLGPYCMIFHFAFSPFRHFAFICLRPAYSIP